MFIMHIMYTYNVFGHAPVTRVGAIIIPVNDDCDYQQSKANINYSKNQSNRNFSSRCTCVWFICNCTSAVHQLIKLLSSDPFWIKIYWKLFFYLYQKITLQYIYSNCIQMWPYDYYRVTLIKHRVLTSYKIKQNTSKN